MIEQLTPEQEAKFPEYVKKYTELGTSTSPLTDESKQQIIQIMGRIYEVGELKPPETVLFFDSPMAALKAATEAVHGPNYTHENLKEERSNMCYGSQDAAWLSFYAFFKNETPVTGLEVVQPLIDLLGLCSFYLPYDGVCFVSQNPTVLKFRNEVLHCTDGPAWSYADGFCGYSLYGTTVTADDIERLKNPKRHAEILKLKNAELRMLSMRALGANATLRLIGGKQVDTKGDLQPDGRPEYVLHKVMIEGEANFLLEMQNPSEPKRHYEYVSPKANTITKALAWRIRWNMNNFKEPVAKT